MNASDNDLRGSVRLLGQGLSLALFRRPDTRIAAVDFSGFLVLMLVSLLAFEVQDWRLTEGTHHFIADNLGLHGGWFLAVLMVAWLSAKLLLRPAMWLSLGSVMLAASLPWSVLQQELAYRFVDAEPVRLGACLILIGVALWAVLLRVFGTIAGEASFARRLAVTCLAWGLLAAPWNQHQVAWLWFSDEDVATEDAPLPADALPDSAPSPTKPPISPAELARAGLSESDRRLLAEQPARLKAATGTLRAQTPGKVDLYAIGFAGDGEEAVFRNEVEFFDKLVSARFNAQGRILPLINSPLTTDQVPLATLDNLRTGLADVARRMDTREDVLLLFLTSHGSREHELFVQLGDLPLQQITPRDLRSALDDAGIRWRVVVVSACFSGGFIDALRDAHTLVITASRRDRSSFGCGNSSDITWFGKAFLADGLNHSSDFREAYAIASRRVREWELAEDYTPSSPQISEGALIGARLDAWRATLAPSEPVPFVPAVPASKIEDDSKSNEKR